MDTVALQSEKALNIVLVEDDDGDAKALRRAFKESLKNLVL